MKIHLSDFMMAYHDQGEGTPLLLIHGFPLNRQMWQPQFPDLAKSSRLIAPDLRGHGDSEAVHGAYTMEAHAQDCHELLEKLAIQDRVVLCGLSMGGYIALTFYRLYPHRVAGLVLASTRAAADSDEAKANRDKSILLAQEQGIPAIAAGMAPRLLSEHTKSSQPHLVSSLIELMEHNSQLAVQGDLYGMKVRQSSIPWLAEIPVPVQIIHGAEDTIVPLEEAIQMQNQIPDASLFTIPQAAHLPNLEQPMLFNQCVKGFIQKLRHE